MQVLADATLLKIILGHVGDPATLAHASAVCAAWYSCVKCSPELYFQDDGTTTTGRSNGAADLARVLGPAAGSLKNRNVASAILKSIRDSSNKQLPYKELSQTVRVDGTDDLDVLQVGGLRLGPTLELICIRDQSGKDEYVDEDLDEYELQQLLTQSLALYLKDSSTQKDKILLRPLASFMLIEGSVEEEAVTYPTLLKACIALDLPIHNLHTADMVVYVFIIVIRVHVDGTLMINVTL